jgi:hypothetical protein
MAHFDKSLKVPMGQTLAGGLGTSSFADTSAQRGAIRYVTRAGPGFYQPQYDDFVRYEGPHASPGTRQPLRQLPVSSQLRKVDTRFASFAPQREPTVHRDARVFPSPGQYALERYSDFSLQRPRFERCQPFAAMQTTRSSIRDVYPDRRCGIICRQASTPSPTQYAPVPALDRLRMSMPNPPTTGRIRATRGATLDAMLRSSASLDATLNSLKHDDAANRRARTAL